MHPSYAAQIEEAREAQLKGPHSFPLERLLAIFWTLLETESAAQDDGPDISMQDKQSCEVFMQITSLVSLRLLSQVAGSDIPSRELSPESSCCVSHLCT